ncbi:MULTISPECIES: hypothetical protein [Pseudonocardia]|uniref:hypothetical protein n=1 Tax=Pseudonocardia TaxID=1847 RepID=UPI0013023C31|nr:MULTISPECIES: hypothetical protein [Pseudonocardia]
MTASAGTGPDALHPGPGVSPPAATSAALPAAPLPVAPPAAPLPAAPLAAPPR